MNDRDYSFGFGFGFGLAFDSGYSPGPPKGFRTPAPRAAHSDGWRARMNGENINSNPFNKITEREEYEAWNKGWNDSYHSTAKV